MILLPESNKISKLVKMASSGLLGRLKQFDAYPKTLEDFRIKTYGGAASKTYVDIVVYLNVRPAVEVCQLV